MSRARPPFARFEFPPALDAPPLPHWPLAATAQHVLLTQVRRVLSLRGPAWSGDVEAIRRLRVAARRARTALADFAALWHGDAVRDARRILGRLAEGLSKGRDLDVTLALLDAEIDAGNGGPALAAARQVLHERRLQAQADLRDVLASFELAGGPARLVTLFASEPLDLWGFVDVKDLLRDEGPTHS